MAIDKDPSIYRDRGTIGSSDELDEYGVWVKSEPQVLRADSPEVTLDSEPALPDIEDLPDLDLEMTEDMPQSVTDDLHIEPSEELVPDFSDLPTFSMDENMDEGEVKTEFVQNDEIEPLSEDSFTELSMDDFLDSSESTQEDTVELAAEAEGEEIEDIDLDFTSADEPNASIAMTPSTEPLKESVALETVSEFDDFLSELSDQSSPTPPPVSAETLDSLPELNIDLDINEEEELIPTMNNEEISVDLSTSEGVSEAEENFDDVGAFGKALEDEPPQRLATKPDLSTELLMRIADELSSIKIELSSLKGELSVLRSAAKPEIIPTEAGHESPHGFFDEEDDEKIALTGDELDNILNTADFTEEAGSDAGEEIENEASTEEIAVDFLSEKPDIITEEEPAIESIDIIDDEIALEEPLELAELRESGVTPMTPAPEDTSYLEQEEIEIPPLSSESIDFSEAVIEEPDLGDFTLDEPNMEEPSIESIDIDLDLEEPLHVEEIVLPVDTKEESFEEVLPEGFVVESENDNTPASNQEEPEIIAEELESEESAMEMAPVLSTDEAELTIEDGGAKALPQNLRQEVRAVLSYMDQLLESLPESKIEEFARSEYFDTYKKLFEELGIA
ncbi:MAG: hypothetical protein WCT14_18155 [Treponemataceae bacterium]